MDSLFRGGEAELGQLALRALTAGDLEAEERREGTDDRLGGPEAEHLGEVELVDVREVHLADLRGAERAEVGLRARQRHVDEVEQLVVCLDAARA